jgi:hypothetical protein
LGPFRDTIHGWHAPEAGQFRRVNALGIDATLSRCAQLESITAKNFSGNGENPGQVDGKKL